MSVDFSLPPYRTGSSDLTVSISPLGLVELSDEEFEVHGPRLNRYALNWAFYLGRHWSYMREVGEPQVTFNYFRAFTDYHTTFTFGRGVDFRSPQQTEAIIPNRLKRIWEVDNDRRSVLYEMGQQGGVSGDCFVKVAYEEPYEDAAGNGHPGRVRILPLSAAHCFPEWHPHDRERFIRFKLKYRFWGTSPEGARQVYTYTEILTDEVIEEYVNDMLIDQRPNPLGVIPIVHIPNRMVSGSPWGLSDCHDVVALNRTYNEIATEAVDIINYYAAPVTVVLGAKTQNLERGPKKVWAIPTAGADVKNLDLSTNGVQSITEYLEILKRGMHEMVGIPQTALGEAQPISNTSGVALSIQFQPLMMQWRQKIDQYGIGLERINEIALRTLFMKEPEQLVWDPEMDSPLAEGQVSQLNPEDPVTYQCYAHFPPPMPIDRLIALNEIQMLMQLRLESRKGALRLLGEAFPEDKLEEIRTELLEDTKVDGAIQLLQTAIHKEILDLTGMMPSSDGAQMPPMQDEVTGPEGGLVQPAQPQQPQPALDVAEIAELTGEADLRTELVTKAYGTKLPSSRKSPVQKPDGEDSD